MKLLKYRTAKSTGGKRIITHNTMFITDVDTVRQDKYSREAVIIKKSGEEIWTIDSKTTLNKQLENNA